MSDVVTYPAVCATRIPAPVGHEACQRVSNMNLDGGVVAHLCPDNFVLSACLVGVTSLTVDAELERVAALAVAQGARG